MPDFNFKAGSFPIGEVIQASQRKAQLEQSAKQTNNENVIAGIKAIGDVGQTLVDKRMKVATALAVKNQFFPGMPDDVAKNLDPDVMIKMAGLTKGNVDMQFLMSMLHPGANTNPGTANPATPVSQPTPNAAPASGAMLTGGLGAPVPIPSPAPLPGGVDPSTATVQAPPAAPIPVPTQMPPIKSVNPATFKAAMTLSQNNRLEPVMTRAEAQAAGGVKHGTHILPDAKDGAGADIMDPKYQGKLEKQYADMKLKALSNRSGGLGLQDSKVNQAYDLRKLVNKYYDPQTDTFNVPPSQHAELALGLARLVSPTGQVGVELMKELRQKSGREALADALIYAGADPAKVGGPTQDIVKMFVDSIDRQGETAEQLRDQYMQYISDNAPIDLDPARKASHDKGKLNSFNNFLSQAPDKLPKATGGTWTDDHEKRLQMLLDKQKNGSLKS